MKTLEEMAKEHTSKASKSNFYDWQANKDSFIAGYKAAKEQLGDANKKLDEAFDAYYAFLKANFYAGYKAAQQWISVKDRFPEEGTLVLLTDKDDSYNRISVGYRMFSEFDGYSWYVPGKVLLPEHFYTHWQPLPKALKEEV